MKNFTRLALIMFSIFLFPNLATTVHATDSATPSMGAPAPFDDSLMGAPAMGHNPGMNPPMNPGTMPGMNSGTMGHNSGMNPPMNPGTMPGMSGNDSGCQPNWEKMPNGDCRAPGLGAGS